MTNPGTPQPGQQPYAQPPYGQPPYGQPQYSQPLYGQPAYGAGYPPPAPKKKGLRAWQWVLMSIGGVIILCCGLGIIGAAVGGHPTTTSTDTGNTSTSNTSTQNDTSSASQGPAKVGSTITEHDIAATLVSVKVIRGDDFIQPKAGNEFVVVHVKLVNNSSSEFTYSLVDFHAKSGTGNITNAEVIPPSTYTANNQLEAMGTLAAGGSTQGDIILQVPVGDHKAQLTWQPSLFDDKSSNAWLMGL